ncbi:GntR family transcriptional regulator [Paenibacillus silagei]|uniref:DNA-binding LacI/PurR family transcriptional regulator n=1 Tax=Paenibacillus silagei TaxID=1670801 RepID=A0ABS4NMI2_9BACL|nr:GntR family transcriptional regulator [Paenibacillus silagei]MBP2110605.1 DNA-binding LacI/PurR family transcriptional regulator [Paenibacillus silagei]
MNVDKSDKTPMYQYIMNDIKHKIETGELRPHDPLPTQIDLAKEYNTSEITSRRALSDLVQEGYVYRIRGKGSFIQEKTAAAEAKPISTLFFAHLNLELNNFSHPFFSEMFDGIREVCGENGVAFHLWDMGTDYQLPEDPNAGIILLTTTAADSFDIERLTAWRQEERRMVTVHFYYPHLGIPYVIVDNLTGGYLATQHLISLGHRRIGIIVTGKSIMEINQEFSLRLQGYRLALTQHQIPFDPQLVAFMDEEQESVKLGAEGFEKLMELEDPPTAIFATSDYKAIGAMNAARAAGMRVPQDISIMGYDDMKLGEIAYPSLSTVNQNTRKVGERAAEILLFELAGAGQQLIKDEIVPTLIPRASTGPAPQ